MTAGSVTGPCDEFDRMGYCTFRFDMPGCGANEGPRSNLICLEQVQYTVGAFRHLRTLPQVKGDAIVVAGSSFGGAVAVYAVAVESGLAGAGLRSRVEVAMDNEIDVARQKCTAMRSDTAAVSPG